MKFLHTNWFLAILALVLNLLTTGRVIYTHHEELAHSLATAVVDVPEELVGPFWNFNSKAVDKLVAHLKEETKNLKDREESVLKIEARLEAEMVELDRIRKQIEIQRDELSKFIILIEKDEIKNLRTLASTYSNLSPLAAVSIFGEMNDNLVVKILSQMKPDVVGPIFEQMVSNVSGQDDLPQRAALLSERLRLHHAAK